MSRQGAFENGLNWKPRRRLRCCSVLTGWMTPDEVALLCSCDTDDDRRRVLQSPPGQVKQQPRSTSKMRGRYLLGFSAFGLREFETHTSPKSTARSPREAELVGVRFPSSRFEINRA